MKLELNIPQIRKVLVELGFEDYEPSDIIRAAPRSAAVEKEFGGEVHGLYYPGSPGHVIVFTDLPWHERNRLRFITNEVNRTVLHELRHMWQHRNWTYDNWNNEQMIESDAIRYEKENGHRFHTVRITLPKVRSGFTKLAAAEGRVRAA